jgi:hypothetical protein
VKGSTVMDRLTVKIIQGIIQERIDELRGQWADMERGTLESSFNLERTEELLELKWIIIDAAEAAREGLHSV